MPGLTGRPEYYEKNGWELQRGAVPFFILIRKYLATPAEQRILTGDFAIYEGLETVRWSVTWILSMNISWGACRCL